MKHLNHTGLIFLLLFAGGAINTTWSQAEAIVKGKVTNEKGTPVKNAAIKVGSRDARTNDNGFFVVKNTEFPAQLTVNHPLYSEYLDMIVLPEKWKDTIQVSVVLLGKETQIEEVTVSAEQIFWVYPRKQANVLDFLVQPDDGILLCCSDENRYFMRSLNAKGEKTNEIPIRNHPKQLYRDCMETIHLIYSDSIYETAVVNNSMGIFQPLALSGIYNLLKSCVYKDDKNLVKYNYSNEDQRIEYLAINIQSKRSKTLYVGEDRTEYRQMEEYEYEHYRADEKMFHSQDSEELKKTRKIWNNKQFYELIVINPVYIPLFELNDSLFIFDHVNDSAVVFTKDGMRVRSFPIFYQYFDGWKKELITNLEKTKIFARYDSEGITTLREINPTNGKIQRTIQLEKHVFPEHLQIHGDFIYYTYKDYLDQSMHYIFKQHLE
ncbi:hypothetical protein [Fluviicola taffensis]|uniref:carboxypeptidase-like regulatory domain-containing protein n=1 Tax=Fluviicola taffensis TaxID=191579 RepID=UPI0031382404